MSAKSYTLMLPIEWVEKNSYCDIDHLNYNLEELSSSIRCKFDKGLLSQGYLIYHDKPSEGHDPHCHALLRFSKKIDTDHITEKLNIDPKYVLPTPIGRYGFDISLASLIHYKDSGKVIYDPNDVFTVVGEEYLKIFRERSRSWETSRFKDTKKSDRTSLNAYDVDDILLKIHKHKLDYIDIQLNNRMKYLYDRNSFIINDAFENEGIKYERESDDKELDTIGFMLDVINKICMTR